MIRLSIAAKASPNGLKSSCATSKFVSCIMPVFVGPDRYHVMTRSARPLSNVVGRSCQSNCNLSLMGARSVELPFVHATSFCHSAMPTPISEVARRRHSALADMPSEHRPEAIPPETYRLVAQIDPLSASKSSTFRSDSRNRTYIITTKRMISGEELKYRNGLAELRELRIGPPCLIRHTSEAVH